MPTAEFRVVEGQTDRYALHEVWDRNDYRLDSGQVAGKVVLDFGANLGGFSVLAAKLGADLVEAYEPHPETFAALVENLDSNGVRDRVEPWRYAVGGEDRQAVLYREGGAAGLGARTFEERTQGVEVGVVDVNAVFAPHETVGFWKCDVEGGEVEIFEAITEKNLDKVERLAMEFHGPAMPHLSYLDPFSILGPIVVRLSEFGTVDVRGKASRGGMLFFEKYGLARSIGRSRRVRAINR